GREGEWDRLGGRAIRAPALGRAGLLLVRHRRGRSRVRAGNRHARGRRAHGGRGAGPGARASGHAAGGRGRGRGLAALRRAGPGDRAARRQPPLRARQRPGPEEMNPARIFLGPPSVRTGLMALATTIAMLLPAAAWAAPTPVATIEIEGVISPVTLRLVGLAIDRAQAEKVQALVILLDTPGGLERSMRAIVQRMMNAEVPVVVFVAPTGARAASAGVFITMA